jgi:hypothetical protein
MRRSGRLEQINRELQRLREWLFAAKGLGNDSRKSQGVWNDLTMPATGGETCYTNSRH